MLKKYDKIVYIDEYPELREKNTLQITIKYDGSNGRLGLDDKGRILFGTRNQYHHNIDKLSGRFPQIYKPLLDTIHSLKYDELLELTEILGDIVLFFELCGRENTHKLFYDWDLNYIVFDGWSKSEEKYISFDDERVNRLIELLQMEKVEVLPIHSYKEAYDWIISQNGSKVEGVVLKDYNTNLRCKILHPKNKEVESTIFKKNKNQLNHNESKFIHYFVTSNRIEKIYFKVIVEEDIIGMKAFGSVLKKLYRDLIRECLPNFILREKVQLIDISYIKKEFPRIAREIFMRLVQK